MRKLNLKTNYEVLLWHFVDSLSRWDYFVDKCAFDYFSTHWQVNGEDEKQRRLYTEIRASWDWPEEIDLFRWAYDGFQSNEKYNPLKPIIDYFAARKDREDRSLGVALEKALPLVNLCQKEIARMIIKVNLDEIVEQLCFLFDCRDNDKPLDAFLAYAFTPGIQGGANGDGIYAEVSPEESCKETQELLIHESFHKVLSPREYFVKTRSKELRSFYEQKIDNIHMDTLAGLLDEVVVHTVSDVILFDSKPALFIEQYEGAKHWPDEEKQRIIHLWRLVGIVEPLFRRYLDGKLGPQETMMVLQQKFREYIEGVRT